MASADPAHRAARMAGSVRAAAIVAIACKGVPSAKVKHHGRRHVHERCPGRASLHPRLQSRRLCAAFQAWADLSTIRLRDRSGPVLGWCRLRHSGRTVRDDPFTCHPLNYCADLRCMPPSRAMRWSMASPGKLCRQASGGKSSASLAVHSSDSLRWRVWQQVSDIPRSKGAELGGGARRRPILTQ